MTHVYSYRAESHRDQARSPHRLLAPYLGRGRVLIVANRLPVTVSGEAAPDDDQHAAAFDPAAALVPSPGGLATALSRVHGGGSALSAAGDGVVPAGGETVWLGWNGLDAALPAPAQRALDDELARRRLRAVSLTSEEVSVFYERIANGVLWPMFHDQLAQLPYVVEGWEVYEAVNERFADAVAAEYRHGDTIWVHDYHLLRLPALLRERIPGARIGFFLHVPFPSPEIYLALPRRRWLLEGMLGADVIGFHTKRYASHFAGALRRLMGIDVRHDVVQWDDRDVRIGAYPMAIDAQAYAARAGERDVAAEMVRLRMDRGVRLLVGVDRLDYSKGIPHRLLAFERLLTRYPQWREHIRLLQVAVPSRSGVDAYQRIRQTVEQIVGRINGEFGTPRWTPIRYVCQGVSDVELSALYRAADVLLVTPLRDGMNLVAKEFVASRTDGDGVLVLSEFAGAADELTDALLVNPYDVDGMADAIHRALSMHRVERRERMRGMRERVMGKDVVGWAESFVAAVRGSTGESALSLAGMEARG
jgi:trehalose 6-phosphate synthase/phosphatase